MQPLFVLARAIGKFLRFDSIDRLQQCDAFQLVHKAKSPIIGNVHVPIHHMHANTVRRNFQSIIRQSSSLCETCIRPNSAACRRNEFRDHAELAFGFQFVGNCHHHSPLARCAVAVRRHAGIRACAQISQHHLSIQMMHARLKYALLCVQVYIQLICLSSLSSNASG